MMGLFGKLFEKKICDLCGEEIGLLGNRKLEDGNCCKNCAAKLSPWFSDRRQSTVEEIREQLAYREENRNRVAQFHTTRSLGRNTKVLLDEDGGCFMVTSARDLEEANPDVLEFSQVTGCELEIDEDRDEVEREIRDKDGHVKHVSYAPPRYRYSYNFYIVIHVNHPYFDEIRFRLNEFSVDVEQCSLQRSYRRPGASRPLEGSTTPPTLEERRSDQAYAEYENMGLDIKQTLTQVRTQVREEQQAAAAPRQSVTCPWCGAPSVPDENGCCPYCGGALNG